MQRGHARVLGFEKDVGDGFCRVQVLKQGPYGTWDSLEIFGLDD